MTVCDYIFTGALIISLFFWCLLGALRHIEKTEHSAATQEQCCGNTINQLFDRIERLQAEVRHQTQQKINAMQDKQPLQERIREIEQELAACQAHVAFGEPYEVRQ